jgi:hypothetical protein
MEMCKSNTIRSIGDLPQSLRAKATWLDVTGGERDANGPTLHCVLAGVRREGESHP